MAPTVQEDCRGFVVMGERPGGAPGTRQRIRRSQPRRMLGTVSVCAATLDVGLNSFNVQLDNGRLSLRRSARIPTIPGSPFLRAFSISQEMWELCGNFSTSKMPLTGVRGIVCGAGNFLVPFIGVCYSILLWALTSLSLIV